MKLRIHRRTSTRGQAMTEYISIVTVLLLGSLAAFVGWPFTSALFAALQGYIDLYFYALNIAIG